MEMYKKPVMKIVELEKVDVLTCSQSGSDCGHAHHWDCQKNLETGEYDCGLH